MTESLSALLARKRDGLALPAEAIARLVTAIAERSMDDGQVGALAMAVRLRGMDEEETAALTLAMADSGQRLRWPRGAALVDKHSTGGVGDCTSLIVAPLLAACGLRVPMVSGRGLGHTGGTLDKLEALAGYRTQPGLALLRRALRQVGCAIVGAGPRLAPADRRLYAVRDVTATVDSIPLVVASILSKKLAAGIEVLVLDVKQGSGAFFAAPEQAAVLAGMLRRVAQRCGLKVRVLQTDMQQPLASAVGHSLELRAVFEVLRGGDRPSRLRELSLRLAAEALHVAGAADSLAAAREQVAAVLQSGAAAERFERMVEALGGPAEALLRADSLLPDAPVRLPVPMPAPGWVAGWDARALGELVVGLGGGRERQGQAIDHRVGLSEVSPIGSQLSVGQPLAWVHAADAAAAARGVGAVQAALRLSEHAVAAPALVLATEGD
jgi:thymidine phosphorylase